MCIESESFGQMRQKGKGVQLTGNLIKVEGIIKDGYVKCLKENIKLGLGYALFFNTIITQNMRHSCEELPPKHHRIWRRLRNCPGITQEVCVRLVGNCKSIVS